MSQALQDDEYYYISHEGLVKLATLVNPEDPLKNTLWTNDYTLELPIRMKKSGPAALPPITIYEMFESTVKRSPNEPAMSVKKNNKWLTTTYQQYYDEVCAFAKGCLSIGLTPYRSVNIIGFNSPEWFISFYGSIFGYYLPVGVYTTNGPEACQYVAQNSDAELIIVENKAQLSKYLKVWDQLPLVKAIVIYNDQQIPEDFIPVQRRNQVYQWKDFLQLGRKYVSTNAENSLDNRIKRQKPGNCCTLVYTSGTTGQPKGVMLTHDNYIYPATSVLSQFGLKPGDRLISYLPLSHVAAQVIDIIGTLLTGSHVYFGGPDALQGSLIETMKEVKPTFFFSVPRVWEKIEEKMKALAASNGFIKRSISNWAKGFGAQGTFAELNGGSTPICFNVAKRLVYNNVKKALGLDQARYLMFGAAPLSPDIRGYFLSLNMFLINAYGMSECSGAQTVSEPKYFDKFDTNFLKSCGHSIAGTEIRIFNPDKDGNGEICYRGRHIFKGYYKNESATRETLDAEGYLHSGDVGKLDKNGNLSITGRIKELLITAGGENVAPVLIEEEIKKELPFISNAMVVGDQRKFLATLLTLKYDLDKNGQLTKQLSPEVLNAFKQLGSNATTFEEAKNDEIIKKRIQEGINNANSRAISNAQQIRKWTLIEGDFTVDAGDLTPTLKLKRKVVSEKHKGVIESFYLEAKL